MKMNVRFLFQFLNLKINGMQFLHIDSLQIIEGNSNGSYRLGYAWSNDLQKME